VVTTCLKRATGHSRGRPTRGGTLDATPLGLGPGTDAAATSSRISDSVPSAGASASYDAHLDRGRPIPAPTGFVGGTPRWSTGVSFVSDQLSEDMVLVGYMKVGLWVSATSSDMDVFVSLRVIDENDREIRYESLVPPIDPANVHPVGHGLLKVLPPHDRRCEIDRVLAVPHTCRGGLPTSQE